MPNVNHEIIDVDEFIPEIEYIGRRATNIARRPRATKPEVICLDGVDVCSTISSEGAGGTRNVPMKRQSVSPQPSSQQRESKRARTAADHGQSSDEETYEDLMGHLDVYPQTSADKCKTENDSQSLNTLSDLLKGTTISDSSKRVMPGGRELLPGSSTSNLQSNSQRNWKPLPRLWTMEAFSPSLRQFFAQSRTASHTWRERQQYRQNHVLAPADVGLHDLLLKRLSKMSGCITKIVQCQSTVAIASATSGGEAEATGTPVDAPDPYNLDGNLRVWMGEEEHAVPAHHVSWSAEVGTGNTEYHKVYTVNDVVFNPMDSKMFLSSGNDRNVTVWQVRKSEYDGSIQVQQPCQFSYLDVPNDIAFKPNTTMLAVACFDGNIHIHPNLYTSERFCLRVASDSGQQKAGAFTWGAGNTLFASSEGPDDIKCQHAAFDVQAKKTLYRFSTTECGDAISLDPPLERLALATGQTGRHSLFLFDVARHDGRKPTHQIPLLPSERNDLEVNSLKFSPDGLLLSVARNDDILHVYDSRFMDQVLHTFRHDAGVPQGYGIVGAQWVEGRFGKDGGLVTAGSDGCVRLWDARYASDDFRNGVSLAQVDQDIAYISLGDRFSGEHRLVVGDCGGSVYIYD